MIQSSASLSTIAGTQVVYLTCVGLVRVPDVKSSDITALTIAESNNELELEAWIGWGLVLILKDNVATTNDTAQPGSRDATVFSRDMSSRARRRGDQVGSDI